jgi:hypothetical protein
MSKLKFVLNQEMKELVEKVKPIYKLNKNIINVSALARMVVESKNNTTKRMLVLEVLDPEKHAEMQIKLKQASERGNEKLRAKKARTKLVEESVPVDVTVPKEENDIPKMI